MAINPTKAMSISGFLSRIRNSGFSRLNRIAIQIKPPNELIDILNYKNKDDYLTYFAESVTIPGIELMTTEINMGGPSMTIPHRGTYREASTTFLVDDDMRQKNFFDAWINFVNPKESKYDFRYRDDYIGEIDIFQISEDGSRLSYGVRMYEVYPIAIAEVKGSWAEQEPMRMDVAFSYRYWRSFTADRYERTDDEAPEELVDIDVIGTDRSNGRDELTDINVIGRTRTGNEVLTDINVNGSTRKGEGVDVLENINVRGRTRSTRGG